jgi:uncharacterized protein YbbK (DUF523 family)
MTDKPLIGVSRCLLGDAVRYDGDSKANSIVIEQLGELFQLLPACPEVEAGFGVPRPPVQLTGNIQLPRMTGRDDPERDVTESMLAYCSTRTTQLADLCGFVFKSRSPSCGLNSTPVFINNESVTESSRGLFARAMTDSYPQLPCIEETGLEIAHQYLQFVDDVIRYQSRTLKQN